jgi:peptidoglycan hydrolase CwlO-like protein
MNMSMDAFAKWVQRQLTHRDARWQAQVDDLKRQMSMLEDLIAQAGEDIIEAESDIEDIESTLKAMHKRSAS